MCICLIDNVPSEEKTTAILFMIINILVPGLGTFIIGIKQNPVNNDLLKTGALQFFMAFIIIGWIWSIWWGIALVQNCQDPSQNEKNEKFVQEVSHTEIKVEEVPKQSENKEKLHEEIPIKEEKKEKLPEEVSNKSSKRSGKQDPKVVENKEDAGNYGTLF